MNEKILSWRGVTLIRPPAKPCMKIGSHILFFNSKTLKTTDNSEMHPGWARHVFTALTFLMNAGVRLPRDVSLISRADAPSLEF